MLNLALGAGWLFALQTAHANTIPAGTTLVVSTEDVLSWQEPVGKRFSTKLASNVVAGGKLVLPAGTPCIGRVTASSKSGSSRPFSVDLTGVSLKGRTIAIKTTGSVEPQRTSRGPHGTVHRVKSGNFLIRPGTILHFQLAQPVTI